MIYHLHLHGYVLHNQVCKKVGDTNPYRCPTDSCPGEVKAVECSYYNKQKKIASSGKCDSYRPSQRQSDGASITCQFVPIVFLSYVMLCCIVKFAYAWLVLCESQHVPLALSSLNATKQWRDSKFGWGVLELLFFLSKSCLMQKLKMVVDWYGKPRVFVCLQHAPVAR